MKLAHILKNYLSKFLQIIVAIITSSCAKDIKPTLPNKVEPEIITSIIIPKIKPKGTEKYLAKNSDYVFDQEKVNTYNLIIKSDDLAKLNSDPTKEEYVQAAMVFEGDTISPVGLRYKGQIGSFAGCVSGPDWLKPSGYKTCVKLSMQVKINWEGRIERFYDLNKLQFHSQNSDSEASKINDRLANYLFREMGVPSPRVSHVRVLINGAYSGLYSLVEEVDNRFVDHAYKTGKGNIYKEVWPLQQNGEPQTEKNLINALKTNETEADVKFMKEFGQAIASTKNPKQTIETYMDVKSIISYVVVDRVIKHEDGPFHWYCDFNDTCFNKNYFWFEDKKNKKIHIIPWDLGASFVSIVRNINPINQIIDDWGTNSNNCKPYTYGNTYFKQLSANCDKLTASWALFDKEYIDLRKHFKNDILSDENVIAKIDTWANQLAPFVKEADDYYNKNATNEASLLTITYPVWQASISALKNQIIVARKLN
jgi:spore coat protein CotH